jgi:DMSO reductase family type II enzyme heme b subunit
MPSFTDALENKLITDEQLWHVAQYVRSLSPKESPSVREVVRAKLVTTLPAAPDDSTWNAAERYWVPVVGQIVVKPRWFAPTVDGVWVQALHDKQRLALRVTWHDPSRSPAPPWDEWLGRVSQTMSDADGALAMQQGPDRLTVEFPQALTDESQRPYFLQGSTRLPAYAWRWSSTPDSVTEGTATGFGHFTARTGAAEVAHAASFAGGEWSVQFSRAFGSTDAKALSFVQGEAIPIGFFVADGSSGEDEVRGSVSTWYAIYLDVPTPRRVYIAPVISMLLTAGLGATVVSRAQRRSRRAELSQQEA